MKQFCKWWLCVFVVFGIASGVTSAQEEWMPDANLRQAVRESLELPDDVLLTQLEMKRLTGLDATDSQITDLTGLESAMNLTWIRLGVNEIRDLSPLAKLVHLEALWIFVNPLSDISPLTNLVNLKTLDFGVCQIANIRPLANLRNLEILRLDSNLIEAIAPLSNLMMLTELGLADNRIADISSLANLRNLETLRLHYNQIQDITPLTNLTSLTELWLTGNRIVDISPLANLIQLESLRLHHNQIKDITPLANLTNLADLWLNDNQIVDVSGLRDLKNLIDLQIADNPIRDFSPLFKLNLQNIDIDIRMLHELASMGVEIPDPNLERAVRAALELPDAVPLTQLVMNQLTGLEAHNSQIMDLTGLEHTVNLTWLDLGGNEISDLRPISELIRLEALYIWDNPISDLSPLENFTSLKVLDLGECQIADLTPLTNLRNLESLRLSSNQIEDITPLANLTNLTKLWLRTNRIMDIRPLENLTGLEELSIQNNWVTDYSPLDTLSLTHFEYDESCELSGLPIQERIENRSSPSVFRAWGHILNRPSLPYEARLAHHDLFWSPEFGLRFQRTNDGIQLTGNLNGARRHREALLEMNPNMIFILELGMRDASPDSPFYMDVYDDSFSWVRDETGNRVEAWPGHFLLDFTHPGQQDIIVQQALAIAKCGLYDGIFLDWWDEGNLVLGTSQKVDGYRGNAAEQRARDTIIQRIRAGVGDDFLIIVNTNRRKIPRTAWGINGTFMETGRDYEGGYTYAGLKEIESTLLWAEENLQEPRINCLEGWGIPTESPDSPRNLRWMRVFTTMSLTHSDGYVLYNDGIQHQHYWYDFWDADLGQPMSAKAQLYDNREGLFIREFTNGWAVYNRSGSTQEIRLPEQATGVESGLQNTVHSVPDLDGEIYLKNTTNKHDINGDGTVNILDLVAVASGLGTDAPDVNGDGIVNILDLVAVANAF